MKGHNLLLQDLGGGNNWIEWWQQHVCAGLHRDNTRSLLNTLFALFRTEGSDPHEETGLQVLYLQLRLEMLLFKSRLSLG